MIDLNEFATRYIALWNEPDAGARRRAIAELFAPEAAHYTPAQEVHGHAELEERVTTAYEKWVKPGAFAFRAVPNANGHHNAVRFNWEMYSVATDETDSVGFDFIVLDERGRPHGWTHRSRCLTLRRVRRSVRRRCVVASRRNWARHR